jgi:hypothetical protein
MLDLRFFGTSKSLKTDEVLPHVNEPEEKEIVSSSFNSILLKALQTTPRAAQLSS